MTAIPKPHTVPAVPSANAARPAAGRGGTALRIVPHSYGEVPLIAPRCWPAVVVVVSWVALTPAEEFAGKVVGVSDGDTITVLGIEHPSRFAFTGLTAPRAARTSGAGPKRSPRSLSSVRS
jgi:endonuclease YncB( thermonuclease family)